MSEGDTTLFDDLAASYDAWYQTPLGALADELERETVLALAGEVDGQTVLDASCGTGHYAIAMAQRGAQAIAVDVSAPMLALARGKAQREGLPLALVRASLEHLPFRAGSFNVVTCVLALEFVADPARVVAELARVQPPGGRLVFGALGRFSSWAVARRLKGLFGPSLWRHARFFGRRQLASLLLNAGYRDVTMRGVIFFPPVQSAPLLAVLRRLEQPGRRLVPGLAAFLAVAGNKQEQDVGVCQKSGESSRR